MTPPRSLVERLRAARSVLVTSHLNPDGDAIGSELGLARMLAAAGKRAAIWNRHPTPTIYRQLPGAAEIHVGDAPPAGFPAEFELGFVLECPSLDRAGHGEELADLPLLNVDHHLGNTAYGAENWVDPAQPAVALMVAAIARALGAPVDSHAANCLLVGLTTDTGGFRFGNASPLAFRGAADLVEMGADVETVARWIYESRPAPSVRLLGELLGTLSLHHQERVASVFLTREMFARAGAGAGDSESLIDTPRTIAGVEAVVLCRELDDGGWKVSLRSRGSVDVESIARRHGGGGHPNAAGCRLSGTLAATIDHLVAELGAAIEAAR